MRIFTGLPGPFGVSVQVPNWGDLYRAQDIKVAEYYHQYCAYYVAYRRAYEDGDHKRARKMFRKCRKYAKKLGPYTSHGTARWTFE
jgi:hypothetical protein